MCSAPGLMESLLSPNDECHGRTANRRPNAIGGAGHLSTVSRDTAMERVTGIEPAWANLVGNSSERPFCWSSGSAQRAAPPVCLNAHR
jgi:hypothetical protein